MQYEFDYEQQAFADSLRRLLAESYDYDQRRSYIASEQGHSPSVWSQLAELGALGLPFEAQYGGFDADPAYLLACAQELGRALSVEPFFATVLLAGKVLAVSNNTALKEALLPRIVTGEAVLAFAHEECATRDARLVVAATVSEVNGQCVLNGHKRNVLAAPQAELLLVSARDAAGDINVFAVPMDANGVSMRAYQSVDGLRAANITFDNVMLEHKPLFGEDAEAVLTRVLDEAMVVLAAEALGVMDRVFDLTADYLATRTQFGQPLIAFQALAHRLADMYIKNERMRSLLWAGYQHWSRPELARFAAMLQAELGEAGRFVGQQAIQLHGGIAMTDELSVGAYFKRLTAMELWFGGRDYHLMRLAA